MANVFRNVRLSQNVELNATGGPGFKTSIIETASGDEYRNINWSRQRGRWEIGYTDEHEVVSELIAFFQVMRGRAYGFRFKDWSDYKVDCDFAVGDGTTTVFQAMKVYKVGPYSFSRPLTRLVAPVSISENGVVVSAFADVDTGKITFSAPPAEGAVLHITGEFDVPVRFDIDSLPVVMLSEDVSRLDSVPLIEIRDRGEP